ncbi:MAG: DUF3299 domain-containing protein [Planctomycetota bacterium]
MLGWKDLTVKVEFEDPFAALTQEQLMNLGIVARVRALQARKDGTASEAMIKEASECRAALEKQKIDIDGLLARREEIRQLRKKRASATNPTLNGRRIRMPGYALPLDYSGKLVTEFLLVPWVGACIHTPPPPPNQIVYVTLTKGIKMGSRFQPVWVEGKVKIGASQKSLFLVDGSSDIHIGYTIHAAKVEKYKNKKAKVSGRQPAVSQQTAQKADEQSRHEELTVKTQKEEETKNEDKKTH